MKVLKDSASFLGILAVLTYGYLRLLQVNFYRQLGLSPEDVGLGYAQTLAKGFAAVLILAVFIINLVLVVVIAINVGDRAAKKLATHLQMGRPRIWGRGRDPPPHSDSLDSYQSREWPPPGPRADFRGPGSFPSR